MFRIRFHGRGGQGIKTASRILGTAFFFEEYVVQDAPRYGAERRGAPIFAYVRASKRVINERGIISNPDLIVVADESLMAIPAAGVLQGADEHATLLVHSSEKPGTWKERLRFPGRVLALPAGGAEEELPFVGTACAAAAAHLVEVISSPSLERAIQVELGPLGKTVVELNLRTALRAYNMMSEHAGCVSEGQVPSAGTYKPPDWVDMPFENARISAPAIHASATSVEVKTGLWRTMRPVIEYERCHKCAWICSTFCPDSAIGLTGEGYPEIDYEHCKGCMICMARCPHHAIEAVTEAAARADEIPGGKS